LCGGTECIDGTWDQCLEGQGRPTAAFFHLDEVVRGEATGAIAVGVAPEHGAGDLAIGLLGAT